MGLFRQPRDHSLFFDVAAAVHSILPL